MPKIKNYNLNLCVIIGKIISDVETELPKTAGKFKTVFDLELPSEQVITCVYWGTTTCTKGDTVRLKGRKTETVFLTRSISLLQGSYDI